MLLVAYLTEFMNDWETFDETSLPEKEERYSNLNMEEMKKSDCNHAKRTCKDFEIENLGEYHDVYLRSETSLFDNAFKNFRKMCLQIYELIRANFLSAPALAWQAPLKPTKVKLELLTYIDVVEKGIRRGICHSVNRYAKTGNEYMKDYNKHKESSYLKHYNVNTLFRWAMSQKLPLNGLKIFLNFMEDS